MPHGKISDTKTRIVVTIPKDLKSKAEFIAQQENRSLSNLIVKLVDDYVNINHGLPDGLLKYHELLNNVKKDDTE